MDLQSAYDLDKIRNDSAARVYRRVEQLLEEPRGICTCELCVLDLVAYVLNRIPPRYSVSLLGDLHPARDREARFEEDMERALHDGLERLARHPHHEPSA